MSRPSSLPALAAGLLAVLAACHGSDPVGPGSQDGPLRFAAGANVSDTIDARLTQALIVQVRDAEGNSLANQVVRFQPTTYSASTGYGYGYWPTAVIARLDHQQYSTFEVDTTDASGETSMLVALGQRAGKAGVVVTVPALGLVDTAWYTVLPGAAVRISFTVRDTVALPGAQYALGASMVDRAGNARTEMPAFSGDSHIASVTTDGKVTVGSVVGRGVVRATLGKAVDSATVEVVPRALAAVVRSGTGGAEVALTYLDGSGYTRLASISNSSGFPAISPDGKEVAFQDAVSGVTTLYVVNVATGVRRTLLDPTLISMALAPRYAPDGAYIYFSGRAPTESILGIWRVRTDGTGLERLAQSVSSSYGYMHPEPSRDGLEVAFTDGSANITILTIATGALRTVALRGAFPRYSGDGRKLASLTGLINVLNLDGTGSRTMGTGYFGDGGLTWCPGDACLLARDYYGMAMTLPATGETVRLRTAANFYQASF